jgi:hypothetical protein
LRSKLSVSNRSEISIQEILNHASLLQGQSHTAQMMVSRLTTSTLRCQKPMIVHKVFVNSDVERVEIHQLLE